MTPKSITKRIQVQQIAKLEKRVEELERILKVIQAWVVFDPNLGHVIDLIERTLNE